MKRNRAITAIFFAATCRSAALAETTATPLLVGLTGVVEFPARPRVPYNY